MTTNTIQPPVGPDTTAARLPRKRMSTMELYYRRFVRNKPAVVGVFIFVALVLFSIIGPLVAKYDHIFLDFLNLGTGSGPLHRATTCSPRWRSAPSAP